jgi:ankyrin repeat protein
MCHCGQYVNNFHTIYFPRSPDIRIVMSQDDIDAFVESAQYNKLTPEGVTTAVVTRGIPVNGRSKWGYTALHWAVRCERRELVVALLAAGADSNTKNSFGDTSVLEGAAFSTADILQLLMDGGGSVNEPDIDGQTPLIALARNNCGDAAARLQVLLACPELDLDATYDGKTAEQWAVYMGRVELALAIAEERARRERWSALRAAWIAIVGVAALHKSLCVGNASIHFLQRTARCI